MDSTLLVGIFTLIVTLIIDIVNRIQAIIDNEPQLSFELRNFDGMLILSVRNTGNTKATNIKINIKKIRNNHGNQLLEDFIFSIPFELSSGEKTQGLVAIYGESIDGYVFPYIDIEVSYQKKHFIKKVKYSRQVFFNPAQDDERLERIQDELHSLNIQVGKMRNPILRLANYFDGHQVTPFDELNITANNSFQTDLVDALEQKKNKIVSREECIEQRVIKKGL